MQGSTPDSLLAFHDAGYREVVERVSDGVVVDIGCGVGDETARLSTTGRTVIGIDYSAPTMQAAVAEHPDVRFVAGDGSSLGLRGGSVDTVVSSHIIEHFTNPVLHVAELARVLKDDGAALVITPNAPADFENPFHVYLFEADQLESMLGLFFHEVQVLGIEGDEALRADFAARRASGEKLLKLDFLGLRHRMPRSWYVWSYEHLLPVVYKVLGSKRTGIGSGISQQNFFMTDQITALTPGLFAIARRPRARVSEG
jgi:SAM-dependent methyltransferase